MPLRTLLFSLQKFVDDIFKWSVEWQLPINTDKCSVLVLNSARSTNSKLIYHINGLPLSRTEAISDLGITIDGKLDYKQHINISHP